jgi:RNA polymerase sigma-70 factor, ECF subfamily
MPSASAHPSPYGADFGSIYAAWFADVRRWTRSLGAGACDDDDLAQDVFMVVHRRLTDFDGRNLPGWLYRITAHQVRDHQRRRSTRTFRQVVPLPSDLQSRQPTPAVVIDARERVKVLGDIVARLREPTRSTFVLFDLYGYSGQELAARDGVSINTIRARVQRARKIVQAAVINWHNSDDIDAKVD